MPTPVVAIIAEYNPFHNGHAYQLREIRRKLPGCRIMALMSGSFTQRGEPALLDKWQRAELAVRSGCEAVLELPHVFACRSAQDFARGGVRLAASLNTVTHLAFGAETENLPLLQKLAQSIDTPELQHQLHIHVRQGLSYATALSLALSHNDSRLADLLRRPNNILALEYLRALAAYAQDIQPLLVRRKGTGYHDQTLPAANNESSLPSASALRRALYEGSRFEMESFCPPATASLLKKLTRKQLPDRERLWLPLRLALLRSNNQELSAVYSGSEGLPRRLRHLAQSASNLRELLALATTKRYQTSRLSRLLIHILLRFTQEEAQAFDQAGPLYARLLAAGKDGSALMGVLKDKSEIPLISKVSSYLTSRQREEPGLSLLQQELAYDTWATEMRELALPRSRQLNDFQKSPFICK